MSEFFVVLALCLQALVDELEIELASTHEIESHPGIDNEWWMHINNERFAHMRIWQDKPEVGFSAWYSDYDYLLSPQEVTA